MAVFVDEIRDYGTKGKWSHMWADTTDELHTFAESIGLKRRWVHITSSRDGMFTHYDLRPSKREQALKSGAIFKPLADFVRERRKPNSVQ